MKVKLIRGGTVPILQSGAMRARLEDAALDIANALPYIETHDREPDVVVETHDARLSAAASVTVIHPGMEAIESKHGYLRKAGLAAGYKVK